MLYICAKMSSVLINKLTFQNLFVIYICNNILQKFSILNCILNFVPVKLNKMIETMLCFIIK